MNKYLLLFFCVFGSLYANAQIIYVPPNGTGNGTSWANASGQLAVPPLVGNISIPASATNGITGMRVSMNREAYAPSCASFMFGEVEDYAVVISGGTTTFSDPGAHFVYRTTPTMEHLNVSGFSDGWYTVIVRSENGSSAKKLVIAR